MIAHSCAKMLIMRYLLSLFMGLSALMGVVSFRQQPDIPPSATPQERIYTQTEINRLLVEIEDIYGVGFALPAEWNATTAAEVMIFTDGLHEMLAAFDTTARYLYVWSEIDDPDITPLELFRTVFDPADLEIDRATFIPGNFVGNTLPRYENGVVIGYTLQLTPAGMNSFIIAHELGHVVDGLLEDIPQLAFIAALGGEWGVDAWIPGEGYIGNEILFPRAVAGPNEDFADTFGQMMTGNLEAVPVRYDFMREQIPLWVEMLIDR